MPMSSILPPNAVGFYAMIRPSVFWISSPIESDYEEVAAPIERERPGTPDEIVQAAVQMILRGWFTNNKMKEVPLENPRRQEALRTAKVGSSILAYLRRELFFVITIGDILEDADDFSIETLPAKSIAEAQRLIMARPDVQEIERHKVVSFSPTVRH